MSPSTESNFVYVTFIRTTPEKLWSALTDPEQMKVYWLGVHIESDWKTGAPWKMFLPDGTLADAGEILAIEQPSRIQLKWRNEFRPELNAEGFSVCTIELEPYGSSVRLSITHVIERAESKFIQAVSGGWPKIISNLKSLLETGIPVLTEADHAHTRSAN